MNAKPTIGVIGVGHLMFHVVPGIMRASEKPDLLLGPRNAERARQLSERFDVPVAASNEDVVEKSDIVIVAVRPFQVEEVIANLPWRADQIVLSFAATVGSDVYAPHVNGARVALAMPVVSAEFGESPTCIFPDIPEARALLEPCGSVVPLAKEEDFATASTFGAYFGWVQTIIAHAADWAEKEGLSPEAARAMAAGMMRAGTTSVTMRPDDSLEELVQELCLPGSLTGEGIEILEKGGAFAPWSAALDRIFERIKSE